MPTPAGYGPWLAKLKADIRSAQLRASVSVNRELVLLYWRIGHDILERQAKSGWGSKVVDRLAHDLGVAFPEMKGFSPRNLKYMRAFAESWPEAEFVQQAAAQLPWFHLCTLLDKLGTRAERDWYLAKAVQHGWSRSVLVMQIETQARERTGRATTNFDARLPAPQSDLARETLKEPYRFDFLGLSNEAQERDVEDALMSHLSRFLLELGAGFAFVGRQVHLEVGGEDFYLDAAARTLASEIAARSAARGSRREADPRSVHARGHCRGARSRRDVERRVPAVGGSRRGCGCVRGQACAGVEGPLTRRGRGGDDPPDTSPAAARRDAERLIAEKLGAGYVEIIA